MSLSEYIDNLASRGRYSFTVHESIKAIGSSNIAVLASLRRLKQKGLIAIPCRGFCVIIPPEYRHLGCLPPEQFMPDLMDHLKLKYYAGLLSAAEFYGASHQRPQIFQVIIGKNRQEINCGKIRIRFIARANADEMPVSERNTPRGRIKISTPETTAFDLVGYYKHCGGLNNVITILSELSESMNTDELKKIVPLSPVSWSQRLGYLLDKLEKNILSESLVEHVRKHAKDYIPLSLVSKSKETERNNRWKLIINEHLEPES